MPTLPPTNAATNAATSPASRSASIRCPRCLECRYSRIGIPEDARCPECSAPAPPPSWRVIFGSSTDFGPEVTQIAAGVMVGAGALLLVLAWFSLARPPLVMASAMMIVGTVLLFRSRSALERLPEGGDVVWVLKDDCLESRGGLLGSSIWRWDAVSYAILEFGWRGIRLSVGHAIAEGTHEAAIWLRVPTAEARELHHELQARIAAAQADATTPTTTPTTTPATTPVVNPPASPPPPPS